MVMWDKDKLRRFKRKYKAVCKKGEDRFEFETNLFLTEYARYLIQYLEMEFEKGNAK